VGLDLVFLGLPHEASLSLAPQLLGKVGCVVDLSAAYRLKDASLYPTWYGFEHDQPELLGEAVYGLPELYRSELKGARLIATPGCYVTAASLALAPLIRQEFISSTGIVVDAASGVSGAGRALKHSSHFSTVDEDFTAYGLVDHRHTPEIEQNIGGQVIFTPHLAPMNRGILATCYARPTGQVSTESLLAALGRFYEGEPFVSVRPASPSTKATPAARAPLPPRRRHRTPSSKSGKTSMKSHPTSFAEYTPMVSRIRAIFSKNRFFRLFKNATSLRKPSLVLVRPAHLLSPHFKASMLLKPRHKSLFLHLHANSRNKSTM
jgi:hypothetical protein